MQQNMADDSRRLQIAFMDFINYNKEDISKEISTGLTKTRKKKLARYSDKSVSNANSSASVKTKTNAGKGKIKFPTIFGNSTIEIED